MQRGNNRQPIAVDAQDRDLLVALLAQHARACKVAVHAYVVMPNHFHLLCTPQDDGGLSRLMQAVGRAYVRAFNQRHGRSGTLWEGRYRSTILEAERHLLPCMVYIDSNPVRAGLVARPEDHAWSSYGESAGLRPAYWLTPHAVYWALGNTPFAREAAYAGRVQDGLGVAEAQAQTQAVQSGWALGSDAFRAELQARTERRVQPRKPGRPRADAQAPPAIPVAGEAADDQE